MHRKVVALVGLFVAGGAHAAPTVLGTATLNNQDDLTRVQLDGGEIVEWLDLSETLGVRVSDAVATFAADGFHVATLPEVQELLDAFGLPTVTSTFPLASAETFPTTQALIDDFQSFLGVTFTPEGGANSTGWLDDRLVNGVTGVLNVRGEHDDVFVNNFDAGFGDDGCEFDDTGVWLVRVPEPGAAASRWTLLGLVGAGLCLRRGRHT